MWYFVHEDAAVSIRALANAGTFWQQGVEAARLQACRTCLKGSGGELADAITDYLVARIRRTPALEGVDLWTYYPTSRAGENSVTIGISSFLQQVFGGIHEALLVRHAPAQPRHLLKMGKRDPTSQLATVHLAARDVAGKRIAVLDDYLTYGVSFGVAIALLQHAGARSVQCLAIGKYGRNARRYDIEIVGNPCEPLRVFSYTQSTPMGGTYAPRAHREFVAMLAAAAPNPAAQRYRLGDRAIQHQCSDE